ncbi:MAG: DNA repair protein RecO [Thiotrichaceae bacterium]|nr:DNA repair protein RecO [Thiotrichaceae bacterium]
MQNRINDQPAFILHRRDYQDSSLILDLFSQDFGRVSVLVKGAKKRRDVSSFQICNRLSVGWSGHSELKILTQIDSHLFSVPAEYYPSIFYINELLLYLLPKHDEQINLFQLYQSLLVEFTLPKVQLEPLLRNFEIELLTELGYMPDLSVVSNTGQNIQHELYYVFDEVSGLIPASKDVINSFSGSELTVIFERQFVSPENLRAAKRLMRQIIHFNLQGRTLQSRKFYQQINKK